MNWVRFFIDISMECLSLLLRLVMAGRLESILVYVFHFISQFEAVGGRKERDVPEP